MTPSRWSMILSSWSTTHRQTLQQMPTATWWACDVSPVPRALAAGCLGNPWTKWGMSYCHVWLPQCHRVWPLNKLRKQWWVNNDSQDTSMPSMHTYRIYTWFFLVLGWLCNVDIHGRIHLISKHIREQWCMAIWISLFGAGRLKILVNLLNMHQIRDPSPAMHRRPRKSRTFRMLIDFIDFHCSSANFAGKVNAKNTILFWDENPRIVDLGHQLLPLLCYIEMNIPNIPRKMRFHLTWTTALINGPCGDLLEAHPNPIPVSMGPRWRHRLRG